MRPPYMGKEPYIRTGWRYSDGGGHFAYDYDMSLGTPVFAINDGIILDCADGSPNDNAGDPNFPNEPSNWILLGTESYRADGDGYDVTIYYQHLSPHLKVRKGNRVSEGDLLGYSGNSGNSTGAHLHLAASKGHTLNRYGYMANDGNNPVVIFPPDKAWRYEMALSDRDINKIVKAVWDYEIAMADAPTPQLKKQPAAWFIRNIQKLVSK